jgi:hypothetical protein
VAPLALRRAPEAAPPAPRDARAAPAPAETAPAPPAALARDEVAKKVAETPARRTVPMAVPALVPSRERETSGGAEPRPQAAEANRVERRAAAAPADALAEQAAGAPATSQLKAQEAERADGFADRPASPEKPAAERKLGVAGGGGAFAHPDRALMEDQRYRSLAARRPASAEEARALADAWELFARDRAGDPRADEARVRAIEAGLLAWRMGGDRADVDTARRRGLAYLAEAGTPQRDRVRSALEGASPAPRR